jgi:hypothetical protein
MTQDAVHLRPEAIPLTWSELDKSQRRAFRQLLAILNEARADLDKQPLVKKDQKQAWTPWIDESRKVRVALLSGERGTGKTTVLLSLIEAFKEGTLSPPDVPEDLRTAFADLRNRLVWLDLLDMSPLPSSTNLFAAILARIENRLLRRTGAPEDVGPIGSFDDSGLLEPSAIYQSALSQFARLQNDVALAWEGNLRQRAGSLDPSQYAMEVMTAERVRLSMNERLNRTLEALAKEHFQGTTVKDPLFALPIDDFDLNPLQCLDLLNLLRIISVPRLLFIVLGNFEMAELVVTVKLAGEMQELGGSPSGSPSGTASIPMQPSII